MLTYDFIQTGTIMGKLEDYFTLMNAMTIYLHLLLNKILNHLYNYEHQQQMLLTLKPIHLSRVCDKSKRWLFVSVLLLFMWLSCHSVSAMHTSCKHTYCTSNRKILVYLLYYRIPFQLPKYPNPVVPNSSSTVPTAAHISVVALDKCT